MEVQAHGTDSFFFFHTGKTLWWMVLLWWGICKRKDKMRRQRDWEQPEILKTYF